MVMPVLLLQKPHPSSKSRGHVACLHRRLDSWKTGDINTLMIEGRTIQHRLKQGQDHRGADKKEYVGTYVRTWWVTLGNVP